MMNNLQETPIEPSNVLATTNGQTKDTFSTEQTQNSDPHHYRLIWFQHFHKAAGTSIVKLADINHEVFYSNHDNGNPLDSDGKEIPLWQLSDDELTQFIDHCENTGITFIANEWGAPNFELLSSDPRVVLVTCLRDPLKRFLSNFYFDYWSGYTNYGDIENYINSDGCFTMFDYYCRILSGHHDKSEPLDHSQFEVAKSNLSYFDHIMVLEDKEAFSKLQNFLNWDIKLDNLHQNKSNQFNRRVLKLILSGRVDLMWRRLSHLRRKPTQEFLHVFQQGNKWDIRLYELSKQSLAQRTSHE
ncbi:MAG: hypothetical protein VKL39_16290 [Leptolyngbyaceae bacterium]|nr:hypothetical protein [Leptolyngbyaceae bacterium]